MAATGRSGEKVRSTTASAVDAERRERFRQLPPHIPLDATFATQDEPPPDPEMGRDTNRDFVLRNALI